MVFIFIISILIITFAFDIFLSILNYKNRNGEIPNEVKDVYDNESYKKWLSYTMENYRISLISKVTSFIVTLAFLLFGIFPIISDISNKLSSNVHLQYVIFIGIYFLIEFVLGIIFAYYQRFTIEDKYGFNKSTKKTFFVDQIKKLILTIIIGGTIIYSLSVGFTNVGNMFYLYTLMSIFVTILFINLFYVKLFVPIFNKLRPLEDGELKTKINNFAEKVGYEITKISVIDASKRSTKLNAFFSGFGKYKQVVLYDTLISKMTEDQIVSVLAHEIGHSKHKHIIKNILISFITIAIYLFVLVITLKIDEFSTAFGFESAHFGFGLILFSILISPISILIDLITSGISRKFEYEADHYAVVNGYKKEMEESLKVLARENYSNLTPHPLFVALKYSHPPMHLRIKAIRKIKL